MIDRTKRLAANALKKPLRFRDHVLAELVIRRDKKPGVLSLGDKRSKRTRHQRVGIMEPGKAGFDALLAGERRGRNGGVNRNLVLVANDGLESQSDRGIADVRNRIDAIDIKPFAYDRRTDIRLVLMVGEQQLDFDVGMLLLEIFSRQLGGNEGALSVGIRERAARVGDHPDLDNTVGYLAGTGRKCQRNEACEGETGYRYLACARQRRHPVPSPNRYLLRFVFSKACARRMGDLRRPSCEFAHANGALCRRSACLALPSRPGQAVSRTASLARPTNSSYWSIVDGRPM